MSDQSGYPGDPRPPSTPPPAWQAGPPPSAGYGDQGGVAPRTNTMAVTGFVLAVLGLLVLPIILGPVGLVLGILSLRRINAEPHRWKGKGLAIAAIVVGGIVTALAIVSVIILANDPGALS